MEVAKSWKYTAKIAVIFQCYENFHIVEINSFI